MKNVSMKLNALILLSFLMMPQITTAAGGLITQGANLPNIVTVGDSLDGNSNQIIVGRVGTLDNDPSTWPSTVISAGVSDVNNAGSRLFAGDNGDVVVVWQFVDQYGNGQIGTSVLLAGDTVWHSALISQGMGSAQNDYQVSISNNGEALIVWTAYNPFTNTFVTLGSAALLHTSFNWSAPFILVS